MFLTCLRSFKVIFDDHEEKMEELKNDPDADVNAFGRGEPLVYSELFN